MDDKTQKESEPCVWSCVDDVHMPDTWSGSCGAVWSFIEGGPPENNMVFCPECGGRAEVAPRKLTVWVNVYLDQSFASLYPTEEQANAKAGAHRIGGRAWPLEIEE